MRKYMIGLVATLLVLVCFGAYAEPPVGIKGSEAGEALLYMWADQGDDADDKAVIAITTGGNLSIRGTSGTNEVFSLDLSTGTLTLDGGTTVGGALAGTTLDVSGQADVGSLADDSISTALSTTNAQPVTLSGLIMRLNSNGGANNGTNTITLANLTPSAADSMFYVINTGSSNDLAIAQTGTFKSPAIELVPYEGRWIASVSSNAFYAGKN